MRTPDKLFFITAFFVELEQRAQALTRLAAAGYEHEALTLSLTYIDGLAQKLMWPSGQSGRNFVRALAELSGDEQFGLIHPRQLHRAFATMKPPWQSIAVSIEAVWPTGPYQLLEPTELVPALQGALTPQQLSDVESEKWRGTVAAVAYYQMRIPAIHALGAGPMEFGQTTFHGRMAAGLDLERLQRAVLALVREARSRSEASCQWFGDDATVSDV